VIEERDTERQQPLTNRISATRRLTNPGRNPATHGMVHADPRSLSLPDQRYELPGAPGLVAVTRQVATQKLLLGINAAPIGTTDNARHAGCDRQATRTQGKGGPDQERAEVARVADKSIWAELLGVVFLFAGFLVSIEVFREIRVPFTGIVLRSRAPEEIP
jgi:hypothetical protein